MALSKLDIRRGGPRINIILSLNMYVFKFHSCGGQVMKVRCIWREAEMWAKKKKRTTALVPLVMTCWVIHPKGAQVKYIDLFIFGGELGRYWPRTLQENQSENLSASPSLIFPCELKKSLHLFLVPQIDLLWRSKGKLQSSNLIEFSCASSCFFWSSPQ